MKKKKVVQPAKQKLELIQKNIKVLHIYVWKRVLIKVIKQ